MITCSLSITVNILNSTIKAKNCSNFEAKYRFWKGYFPLFQNYNQILINSKRKRRLTLCVIQKKNIITKKPSRWTRFVMTWEIKIVQNKRNRNMTTWSAGHEQYQQAKGQRKGEGKGQNIMHKVWSYLELWNRNRVFQSLIDSKQII